MDILLKYTPYSHERTTGKKNFFNSRKEVQKYFLNLYKEDKNNNNNYIFFNREREDKDGKVVTLRRFDEKDRSQNIVNENDNIYFLYEEQIIAKAIYVPTPNPKKSDKFKNGYKIRNIILLGFPISLENNPFNNQNAIYFIKEEDGDLKSELNQIFK